MHLLGCRQVAPPTALQTVREGERSAGLEVSASLRVTREKRRQEGNDQSLLLPEPPPPSWARAAPAREDLGFLGVTRPNALPSSSHGHQTSTDPRGNSAYGLPESLITRNQTLMI